MRKSLRKPGSEFNENTGKTNSRRPTANLWADRRRRGHTRISLPRPEIAYNKGLVLAQEQRRLITNPLRRAEPAKPGALSRVRRLRGAEQETKENEGAYRRKNVPVPQTETAIEYQKSKRSTSKLKWNRVESHFWAQGHCAWGDRMVGGGSARGFWRLGDRSVRETAWSRGRNARSSRWRRELLRMWESNWAQGSSDQADMYSSISFSRTKGQNTVDWRVGMAEQSWPTQLHVWEMGS